MKTFAETSKVKKLGRKSQNKGGQQATSAAEGGKQPAQAEPTFTSDSSPIKDGGDDGLEDSVIQARKKLQERFKRGSTLNSSQTKPLENASEEEKKQEARPRNWVTISNKVDAKALAKVNVNMDEAATQMNLKAEMEKYLGGDD